MCCVVLDSRNEALCPRTKRSVQSMRRHVSKNPRVRIPDGFHYQRSTLLKQGASLMEKVSRFDRNWSGGCKLQRGFKVNDREYRLSRILFQIASDFGDEPLSALVVQFFPCACKFYKRLFVLRKIGSHTHERLLCYHYRDAFTV